MELNFDVSGVKQKFNERVSVGIVKQIERLEGFVKAGYSPEVNAQYELGLAVAYSNWLVLKQ